MVDFKLSAGKISVIESAIRPGCSIFVPLMYHVYGFTSAAVMARIFMEGRFGFMLPDRTGSAMYIYSRNPGRIGTFDTSRLEKTAILVHKYSDVGQKVSDSRDDHSGLILGFAFTQKPLRTSTIESLVNLNVAKE